jgi:hypothetical protein
VNSGIRYCVARWTSALAAVGCAIWLTTSPAFTQSATAIADPELQQARQSFDQVNFEAARDTLNSLIDRLSQREGDAAERRVLAAAYELRGRALQNLRDQDGARADFRAMLMLVPNYAFPPEAGARAAALFEEARAATVGFVEIAVSPVDAAVEIDGRPVADRPLRVPLVAGFHAVKASRRGHASLSQQFEVRPGESTTIPVVLTRELTTLTLRTIPANVTVVLDGTERGVTQADSGATPAAENAAAPSRPLVIEELPNGVHRLELRRDCFVTEQQQIDLQKPDDLRLDVLRLAAAVGTVSVRSRTGGTLFVDDKERGSLPQVVEACQGPHVIEVRARTGRDVKRFDVKTGGTQEFEAIVRPAFAIVAPAAGAAADDVRLRAERALGDATSVMFFAPPRARVDGSAGSARVPDGWLSFDASGAPLGPAAALNAAARRTAGDRIAQALDAQGLAAIGADPSDPRTMLVTLLAPGSATPDVLRWRPDDAESVRDVLARLDAAPVLTRRSLGLLALDVLDVQGVVVGNVEAGWGAGSAGLQPGDVITSAGGQAITNVASLLTAVASASTPQIALGIRNRTGVQSSVDVAIQTVPLVSDPSDGTVLANVRAVTLAHRLAAPAAPIEAASLRLNLASAWMRLENCEAATRELTAVESAVTAAAIPAPAKDAVVGNAQYLLGVCAAKSGNTAAAEQAWTRAAQSAGVLLTNGSEPLKDLAEQRLAELRTAPGSR